MSLSGDHVIAVGAAGVDIFFVISGVVMALSTRAGTPPAEFILKRFIRIVPMYWIATLLAVLYFYLRYGMIIDFDHIMTSLLFLPPPPDKYLPVLYIGWSLNYELFFYAIIGSCLFFKTKVFYLTFFLVSIIGTVGHKTGLHLLDYYLYDGLIEFSAGLAIGLLLKNGFTFNRDASLFLILSSLVLFAINSSYPSLAKSIYWGIPSTMLAIGVSHFERTRMMNNNIILMIGAASYSIYLFHPFAIWMLEWSTDNVKSSTLPIPAIVLSTAIGYTLHRVLETPLASIGKLTSRDRIRHQSEKQHAMKTRSLIGTSSRARRIAPAVRD